MSLKYSTRGTPYTLWFPRTKLLKNVDISDDFLTWISFLKIQQKPFVCLGCGLVPAIFGQTGSQFKIMPYLNIYKLTQFEKIGFSEK